MKIPFPKYEADTVEAIETFLDQQRLTQVTDTHQQGHAEDGLVTTITRGRAVRGEHIYARPMFEIIPRDACSSARVPAGTPCPTCDNFAYTSKCEEHPEIPWGINKGVFTPNCTCALCGPGPRAHFATGLAQQLGYAPAPAEPELEIHLDTSGDAPVTSVLIETLRNTIRP